MQNKQENMNTTISQISEKEYSDFVHGLAKKGEDVISTFTPLLADVTHAAIGISGEAGELLDAVKKALIYGKPLDKENIIEELGYIEWYSQLLRMRLGISREEVLAGNMKKLNIQYKAGYTDKAAGERADKNQATDKQKSSEILFIGTIRLNDQYHALNVMLLRQDANYIPIEKDTVDKMDFIITQGGLILKDKHNLAEKGLSGVVADRVANLDLQEEAEKTLKKLRGESSPPSITKNYES